MYHVINQPRRRGSALLLTTITMIVILSFVLSGMVVVTSKVHETQTAKVKCESQYVAEAGINHAVNCLREIMQVWGTFDPIENLDTDAEAGIHSHSTQFIFADGSGSGISGQLQAADGTTAGEYDVYIDVTDRSSDDHRTVTVRSVAYVPSKGSVLSSSKGAASKEVFAQLRVSQSDGKAGNYAYFINHWGWFYGSSITSNGTVRANGKFSFRYSPTVNGSPIYRDVNGSDLYNKISDGGVYAWCGIDGTCGGMGGDPENQYSDARPIVMPNLSNISWYKNWAIANGGTISGAYEENGVKKTFTCDAVYGDDGGEKDNLFLKGTESDPIEINGTVVVDGDLVISGYVTGQGTIISSGNVYVPDDVIYLNGPATNRPSSNSEQDTESWIQSNMDKDFLGLYATEHVVAGDMTDRTWQSYVFNWLNDDDNRSGEDCGLDKIHNTGDEGEYDGEWTVKRYTEEHELLGVIPDGAQVGDPIPGTGEDIDGDGIEDEQITTHGHWHNEFKTSTNINSNHWGGTLPPHGYQRQYRKIASEDIGRLDGCYFTNHAFAGLIRSNDVIEFNGALISRNEAIVYSAPGIEFNHDERLTARSWEDLNLIGGGGKVWEDIEIVAWWTRDA